jgi:hypothetical protein
MNKKRQMSYDRFNVVPTINTSPYAIKNPHYVFRPAVKEVDASNMDLTQARAVINFIKGL